jgi:peptidoglycan/xylan/chitin deacetylase (PgdA/CDA1 family)
MHQSLRAASALVAVLAMTGPHVGKAVTQSPSARTMALTFDDLPYAYDRQDPNYVTRAQRVTRSLLRVLTAHRAPAVAFVNEGKLSSAPERERLTAVLRQWVDAGAVLGNHTYTHPDFNALTVEQFKDEIAKGDEVSRRLMQARRPYQLYFRHPQTHTGDTQAKKEAVEAFLLQRGYRIAPHTIDSADYIFNAGYVQTGSRNDETTPARLRSTYVDFVLRATSFAERVSSQIFGRAIPQTILLHANDLNADVLDELLKAFEARGYAFVSLDTAMVDPAYLTPDTLVTRFGPTWLWRWTKSKGLTISFNDDPEPPGWVTDLYNAATP